MMKTLAGNELSRKWGKSDEVDQLGRFGYPRGSFVGTAGWRSLQGKHWLGLLSVVIVCLLRQGLTV
jgi:hypothetical protein